MMERDMMMGRMMDEMTEHDEDSDEEERMEHEDMMNMMRMMMGKDASSPTNSGMMQR